MESNISFTRQKGCAFGIIRIDMDSWRAVFASLLPLEISEDEISAIFDPKTPKFPLFFPPALQ